MKMRPRHVCLVVAVAVTLPSWLPNQAGALDFSQARVTQVVEDVKVLPSGAAARPATVNETVQQGSAVETGVHSRSELTFQDQTITRLGEKTIFSVGKGGRAVELGSGQFLLYVPKKAGGAKVKMGAVTAAITGTTVMGHVYPGGIVEFTILEGSACMQLEKFGQSVYVQAGQKVVYDPMIQRLENPVDVDIQDELNSPLVQDFSRLPSKGLIDQEIAIQRGRANDELARAVSASGGSIGSATPEQFLAAFASVIVRSDPHAVCALVSRAVRARPDLADRIVVAAITSGRPVRGYSKDLREPMGKEIPCEWLQCILHAATAADPAGEREIVNAAMAAAPTLRDCILAVTPCPAENAFVQPYAVAPVNPSNFKPPVVSPEQPPSFSQTSVQ